MRLISYDKNISQLAIVANLHGEFALNCGQTHLADEVYESELETSTGGDHEYQACEWAPRGCLVSERVPVSVDVELDERVNKLYCSAIRASTIGRVILVKMRFISWLRQQPPRLAAAGHPRASIIVSANSGIVYRPPLTIGLSMPLCSQSERCIMPRRGWNLLFCDVFARQPRSPLPVLEIYTEYGVFCCLKYLAFVNFYCESLCLAGGPGEFGPSTDNSSSG